MAKNITFRVLFNFQTFLFGNKVSWIYFTLASLKKQEKKNHLCCVENCAKVLRCDEI